MEKQRGVFLETVIENQQRENAPIFLTGFSGTGKTTIGQALAFQMNRKFFDLDYEIELLSGLTVARFIQTRGEDAFRKFESQILNTLCLTQASVIALGGGAIIREENLDKVKSTGCLIYLSSTMDRIRSNLSGQKKERPLIKELSDEALMSLFKARESNYLQADIIVELTGQTVKEAADELAERHLTWMHHSTLN